MIQWLCTVFRLPKQLKPLWNDSNAQLSYVLLRGQVNDTAWVVDQPWHIDRDTTEDLRVSMIVHDSGPGDGPLQVFPTSHRFHPWLQVPDASYPRGLTVDKLKTSDILLYFSRTRRRGTKRMSATPHVSLDVIVHSTGRFFHPTSDRDPEKVYERFIQGQDTPAHKATEMFKEMWANGTANASPFDRF